MIGVQFFKNEISSKDKIRKIALYLQPEGLYKDIHRIVRLLQPRKQQGNELVMSLPWRCLNIEQVFARPPYRPSFQRALP